jgi:hypothetical protein
MAADGSSPGKGGGFENRLSKLIINADSGRNGQLFSSARFAEPVSVVRSFSPATFTLEGSFENVNHFSDKVVSSFSRLFIVMVNPSLKPFSIIISNTAGVAYLIVILTVVIPFASLNSRLFSELLNSVLMFPSRSEKLVSILKLVFGLMEVNS